MLTVMTTALSDAKVPLCRTCIIRDWDTMFRTVSVKEVMIKIISQRKGYRHHYIVL